MQRRRIFPVNPHPAIIKEAEHAKLASEVVTPKVSYMKPKLGILIQGVFSRETTFPETSECLFHTNCTSMVEKVSSKICFSTCAMGKREPFKEGIIKADRSMQFQL